MDPNPGSDAEPPDSEPVTADHAAADQLDVGSPVADHDVADHDATDHDATGHLAAASTDGVDPPHGTDPDEPADLGQALVDLGRALLTAPPVEAYLTRVCDLAAQAFTPPADAGVTTYVGAEPATVASSGLIAGQVEKVQYEVDDGPCLQALRTGEVVEVADLATDDRWPAYREQALGLGVGSTYVVPLTGSDGSTVGALNLHARGAGAVDDAIRRAVGLFAAQAGTGVELLHREQRQRALGEQLQEALTSRAEIDQAMGIVMATRRCSAEDAFAFLRRTSQNANRKLRDVAADLVRATATGRAPR